MKISIIIFDLDGTLIDTEKYFKIFWRQAAAQFGYSMTEEQALALRSLGKPFAPALLKEWFGEEFDYTAVRDCRRKLMQEHLANTGLETKPGAYETLQWLSQNGYRVAIATATPADRARQQLQETGLLDFVDEIISAADSKFGKPAPDVYLKAMEALGADASECLAVEDSPNGVMSALAAGLPVVMVPDQTQPDEKMAGQLYACLPELKDMISLLQEGDRGDGKEDE